MGQHQSGRQSFKSTKIEPELQHGKCSRKGRGVKSRGTNTAKRAVPDIDDVFDDDNTTKGSSIPPSDLSDEELEPIVRDSPLCKCHKGSSVDLDDEELIIRDTPESTFFLLNIRPSLLEDAVLSVTVLIGFTAREQDPAQAMDDDPTQKLISKAHTLQSKAANSDDGSTVTIKKLADKKRIKILLAIIVPIILSSVTAIIHCGLLTTLTVKLSKYNHTSSGSVHHELGYNILNIFLEVINVMDTVALAYGVGRFFYQDKQGNVFEGITRNVGCCKLSCTVLWSIFFSLVMLIPPSLLSVWWEEFPLYTVHHSVGKAAVATDWIDFIYNLLARVAMIVATLSVKEEWSRAANELEAIKKDHKLQKMIDCYNNCGERVIIIQNIFQLWFIAKWILYFSDIVMFGTSALTQLTTGIRSDNNIQFGFTIAHLLYDVVAFIIIYVCGSLMNRYHDKFYELMNDEKEKYIIEEEKFWIFYNTNLITKQSKYQFTPSLCGISIPMNNPGFTFTFVISIVVFIAKFLSS